MSSARNWLTRREALALAGGLAAMAMIPENPVVGGTVLRRQAIQSPNFVTGSAGWAIKQDGSAEFNNVVIRNSQVISGTALYYNGAPAFGNLVASIAANSGTDVFGNAYISGITSYLTGTSAVNLFGAIIGLFTAPGAGGPWTQVAQVSTGSGDLILQSNRFISIPGNALIVSSAAAAGGVAKITSTTNGIANPLAQLFVNAAGDPWLGMQVTGDTNNRVVFDTDNTGLARFRLGPGNAVPDIVLKRAAAGILQADPVLALTGQASPAGQAGAAQLFGSISGQPSYVNPQGLSLKLRGSKLATVNTNAVTQTAFNNLFNDTIPANDAQVGTIYEAEVFGFGTWGSTQQQLTLGIRFGASAINVIGTNVNILNTALAASAAFEWYAKIILICVTTGVTATWRAIMTGSIQETANPLSPGTAANNAIPFSVGTGPTDVTLDSTIAEIFGLSAKWASTTGAPTITKTAGTIGRKA